MAGAQRVAGDLKTVVAGAPIQGGLTTDAQGVVDRSFAEVPETDVVCQMILQAAVCLDRLNKSDAARDMRGYIRSKCRDADATPRRPRPEPSASAALTPPASTPVTPPVTPPVASATPAIPPKVPCTMSCDGKGDGTRLKLGSGRTYRFELKSKKLGRGDSFHVMSVARDSNVMLVENSSEGASFSISGDDSLKVCSKLQGTGGGCHWMCSVDVVAGKATLFTDQLSADLAVTCQ